MSTRQKLAEKIAATAVIRKTLARLRDESIDLEHRMMLLAQVCSDDSATGRRIVEALLAAAARGDAESVHGEKIKELNELLDTLKRGPVRLGTYVGACPPDEGTTVRRVRVLLQNGDAVRPLVVDNSLVESLRRGDPVCLDAQASVVLFQDKAPFETGEIAVLKSRIDELRVEVTLHDQTSEVFHVAASLQDELAGGDVAAGARLLVCSRRRMAFGVVPQAEGVSGYRYLSTDPVPEVVIERDIGCPPAYIGDLLDHVRIEMTQPELSRKYRLRRMQTRLLAGVSGSGKSLSIKGLIRAIYELISDITGAPIEAIPPRVLQIRPANILSMWLGESDKNWDRTFDEAEQLERETFHWNGKEWTLPVVCIYEEIDALARTRGGTPDATHDRIQTTALERLDHLSRDLGDKLILFLFTTNILAECDAAFVRRAGGEIVLFGHLGRRQFEAILAKQLRERPYRADLGADSAQAVRRVCRDVTSWMFSPNGHDAGQLEITYAGSSTPEKKFRRDLLTAAMIDRSVQEAAKEARCLERTGCADPGLTVEMVLGAFVGQIQGLCRQINPFNVHNFVSLPDGARVASVRRIEQPTVHPFELETEAVGDRSVEES